LYQQLWTKTIKSVEGGLTKPFFQEMMDYEKCFKYYPLVILVFLCHVPHSGVGKWDAGSVPQGLKPGGTQASFSAGQLMFDPQSSSGNVSALVGKQAVLSCTIRNVNNHSVRLKF